MKEGGGSKGGAYRFNTFRNCTNGSFTLRFARNDLVEGNFFLGTPGIRVYGRDHRIINNYLEGGVIKLGDGAAGAYPGIDNVDVSFNTLVNARIDSEDRGDVAIVPHNLRITNNIIQTDGGSAILERHPFVNVTYAGDILWGHLAPTSPAVNAAVGTAIVTDDIEGQPRAMADVGADEISAAPVSRRPLTPADVGPLGR